jgi:hypothetical protein
MFKKDSLRLNALFSLVFLCTILFVFYVAVTSFKNNKRHGRHKNLAIRVENIGNESLCVTEVILGKKVFQPGIMVKNSRAEFLLLDNQISEYAVIEWKYEDGGSFCEKVNLWQIVPKDIKGEYLTLIFSINSNTNELNVTYKAYDIKN